MSRPPGPPLIGEARSFARDPLALLTGVADKYGDIASFTMTSLRAKINAVVGEGLFTSRGELHARQI